MNKIKKIGLKIKEARVGSGITIRDLSKLSGVSNAYISQIETGDLKSAPSDEKIKAIAEALKMSEEDKNSLLELAALEKTPDSIRKLVLGLLHKEFIEKGISKHSELYFETMNKHLLLFSDMNHYFDEIYPFETYKDKRLTEITTKFKKICVELIDEMFTKEELKEVEAYDIFVYAFLNAVLKKYRDLVNFQRLQEVKSNAEMIPAEMITEKIPVFSYVKAGFDGGLDFPEPVEFIDIPHIKNGHDVVAVYVKGDSMEPRLYDDDIVVVRKDTIPDNGKMGVFVYNNETIVKLFNRNPYTGEIILSSYNRSHFPMTIKEHDDFFIIGKVFKILHNYV